MKTTTVAILLALTLTTGCAATRGAVRPTPTPAPTPDAVPALDDHNVIFPAERADDLFGAWAEPVDGFWTPGEVWKSR